MAGLRFVSDERPTDAEALDAYSQVVTRVAEQLAPSVANVRLRRGAGSAVAIAPRWLPANHGPRGRTRRRWRRLVRGRQRAALRSRRARSAERPRRAPNGHLRPDGGRAR